MKRGDRLTPNRYRERRAGDTLLGHEPVEQIARWFQATGVVDILRCNEELPVL
jgi:hypothetical protein